MTDECKPPEGTEDGSWHWVTHSSGRSEVWVWRSAERLFMRPGRDFYVVSECWRYVAPASPDDAAALAEARAQVAEQDAALDKAACELNDAVEEVATLRAQVAALQRDLADARGVVR